VYFPGCFLQRLTRDNALTFVDEAIEGAESGAVGREFVRVESHNQERRRRVVLVQRGRRQAVIAQFVVPPVTLVDGRTFQVQIQTHVVHAPASVTSRGAR